MNTMNVALEEMKTLLKKEIDKIGLHDAVECSVSFFKLAGQEDFQREISIEITKDIDSEDDLP